MAIGSGLGAQLGIAAETTYGTFVAPTKFLEFTKESLALKKTTALSSGIAAGRLLGLSARRVLTRQEVQGTVDFEVTNKGMGIPHQGLMGTTVTPVQQGVTTAYLQTHTLASVAGKSLTIQKGVPLTSGTVTDKSFVGCKVTSAEFACGVGEMLTCSMEFDGKNSDESQTLAAASYPSMTPFHFQQMSLKTGSFGTETALDGIRKVSCKIERPQDVERFYAGQAGLKKEPIENDLVKISGTLETDYVATTLDDLHTSDGATSMVWEFVGPLIASTFYETWRLTLPAIRLDEGPPVVDGFGVVKPSFNFVSLYDGTNLPKIEIISTDVTL
ncbi:MULTISPECIES: phage tail tube protein [Streptomyces]|uniref:phage tail tube protein n=1 Tax=Streptomyces TaxID=1883 RepID=UPI0029A72724|nr:phage tail tube protein [Streptomyces stelliscabiei]MDX2520593.1 phage tail tube protein [Streptomyces stelliscabiei]MDX2552690.1 phage tail tube protein [Streptomyces stelliscabiei]MDX2661374.1 phage tail tube protein [Streptomyces stelliscabiei]MDX2788855.1 phage tail tube protein [Streptomyces stelliscabiei]